MYRVTDFLNLIGWCWCIRKRKSVTAFSDYVPIFWIMGPRKCGKTTLTRQLANLINFTVISTDELVQEALAKNDFNSSILKQFLASEDRVPDEFIIKALKTKIDSLKYISTGFLIDGFPITIAQARLFEAEVCEVKIIIYIWLRPEKMLERMRNSQNPSEVAKTNSKKSDLAFKKEKSVNVIANADSKNVPLSELR